MKKPRPITIILYAICAAVWSIRAIAAIVFREYESSVFLFVLNTLCAVIWIVAFVIQLKAYRARSDGSGGDEP